MKSFLEFTADELIPFPAEKVLIVFPTQRACREFKKIYSGKKKTVSRLPFILPIAGLLENLSAPVVADDLTLVLLLKEVYDQYFVPDQFETFLPFGQQVIDDFNEIDRQLINAEHLFQEVKDLKEMDERFGPGSEEAEYIKNFWSEFLTTPYTPLQTSFLNYWKQLPELYHGLREKLKSKGLAYEGMAWRHVAETLPQQTYFHQYDKIVFAGFYALNTTEEAMFRYLQTLSKLILLVDADMLYADNPHHEAGLFFRKGFLKERSNFNKIGSFLTEPKKSYLVKGCNGRFSIAREIAITLKNDLQEESTSGVKSKRIVVLADETLLYPLLHQCSLLGLPLNASMGFPLKHHPLYRILQLIRSSRGYSSEEKTEVLKNRLIQEFLDDPLVAMAYDESAFATTSDKKDAIIFAIRNILFPIHTDIDSESQELIKFIMSFRFPKESWMHDVHFHSLHAIETGIKLLALHKKDLSLTVWWQLLLDHFSRQRIPFSSDRESGIPVVGFLESRILDFDVVYIAPLNEGSLPSNAASKSLIPYSLRKAYHLPCKEEQDAVTAYHFYRLLQRASELRFYYNTDLNATGGGERSRYLFQIHQDILKNHPPGAINYQLQNSSVQDQTISPVQINKNSAIIEKLKARFDGKVLPGGHITGLSASALNSYIHCSLKFYFDQIAGIRPDDEPEGLVAGNFGNVLHKCMENAYKEINQVDSDFIVSIKSNVQSIVEKSIKEAYDHPVSSGHDYLMKGVIIELVQRIINFDEQHTPFEIIGLEENLNLVIKTENAGDVSIKGIIDRIDLQNGFIRILDYKTGNDKVESMPETAKLFSDPSYKVNIQLMLYTLLVSEYYPDLEQPLQAGIFRMRQFDEGVEWLNEGEAITASTIDEFKSGLTTLIEEIYNPAVPFSQTDDIKRCRNCDYRHLCSREE